jgi:hypothetical protein
VSPVLKWKKFQAGVVAVFARAGVPVVGEAFVIVGLAVVIEVVQPGELAPFEDDDFPVDDFEAERLVEAGGEALPGASTLAITGEARLDEPDVAVAGADGDPAVGQEVEPGAEEEGLELVVVRDGVGINRERAGVVALDELGDDRLAPAAGAGLRKLGQVFGWRQLFDALFQVRIGKGACRINQSELSCLLRRDQRHADFTTAVVVQLGVESPGFGCDNCESVLANRRVNHLHVLFRHGADDRFRKSAGRDGLQLLCRPNVQRSHNTVNATDGFHACGVEDFRLIDCVFPYHTVLIDIQAAVLDP